MLLVWGSGAAPPILERAWKDSGLGIPILLSMASSSTAFLRAVSDSGEGALVQASTSLLAGSLPAGSAIRKQVDPMATAFQRQNGYYPTQAAFDGYAAVRLLLAAIAAAGSADPARIDAELSRLNLATAAGTFKFSTGDHLGLAADWLTIAIVKDGERCRRSTNRPCVEHYFGTPARRQEGASVGSDWRCEAGLASFAGESTYRRPLIRSSAGG